MRYWFDFTKDWRSSPMAYWVHLEPEGESWLDASTYSPEEPKYIPHKGYAVLFVEIGPDVLQFSSAPQVRIFLETLSSVPLPSSRRLSSLRKGSAGPNSHWLSRLPAAIKGSKGRRKAIAALRMIEAEVVDGNVWRKVF